MLICATGGGAQVHVRSLCRDKYQSRLELGLEQARHLGHHHIMREYFQKTFLAVLLALIATMSLVSMDGIGAAVPAMIEVSCEEADEDYAPKVSCAKTATVPAIRRLIPAGLPIQVRAGHHRTSHLANEVPFYLLRGALLL